MPVESDLQFEGLRVPRKGGGTRIVSFQRRSATNQPPRNLDVCVCMCVYISANVYVCVRVSHTCVCSLM